VTIVATEQFPYTYTYIVKAPLYEGLANVQLYF